MILLFSQIEILNEVRTNGNNLTELLQDRVEQLEPDCLNKALIAAVENDHHQNVGKLIVKGATNISEALKLAVAEKKVYASAMLMLVYAAIDGNCNLVLQLFDEIEIDKQPCKECSKASGDTFTLFSRMLNYSTMDDFQDCLQRIRRALKSSNMPTTIPIEIARRNITATPQKALRCGHVREELLMKTDVNKEDKSVHWQGLGLRSIEIAWFKRVDWVKSLLIGRNQLKVLPKQIGVHLKQVRKTFYFCCTNCAFSLCSIHVQCKHFNCSPIYFAKLYHSPFDYKVLVYTIHLSNFAPGYKTGYSIQ